MAYTKTEKTLHRLYLKNYFLSRSSLEMEEIVFGSKIRDLEISEYVFITGLARSGTTAIMRQIFATQDYASLQYSNMPMVLMPNLWKKKLNLEAHERAHKDGILVDGNSPEEFDEYFWKAFLKDSYIGESLVPHDVSEEVLNKYMTYVALVCFSKNKSRYVSKNNNSILRLDTLRRIPNHIIFLLFREPFAHASSLMKLDKSFTQSQEEDPFVLDYFNFLGHHEFGLGHKPFDLTSNFTERQKRYDRSDINYWLSVWINYYSYLLQQDLEGLDLICFEDLIQDPQKVYGYISQRIGSDTLQIPQARHKPASYSPKECDPGLWEEASSIYSGLRSCTPY